MTEENTPDPPSPAQSQQSQPKVDSDRASEQGGSPEASGAASVPAQAPPVDSRTALTREIPARPGRSVRTQRERERERRAALARKITDNPKATYSDYYRIMRERKAAAAASQSRAPKFASNPIFPMVPAPHLDDADKKNQAFMKDVRKKLDTGKAREKTKIADTLQANARGNLLSGRPPTLLEEIVKQGNLKEVKEKLKTKNLLPQEPTPYMDALVDIVIKCMIKTAQERARDKVQAETLGREDRPAKRRKKVEPQWTQNEDRTVLTDGTTELPVKDLVDAEYTGLDIRVGDFDDEQGLFPFLLNERPLTTEKGLPLGVTKKSLRGLADDRDAALSARAALSKMGIGPESADSATSYRHALMIKGMGELLRLRQEEIDSKVTPNVYDNRDMLEILGMGLADDMRDHLNLIIDTRPGIMGNAAKNELRLLSDFERQIEEQNKKHGKDVSLRLPVDKPIDPLLGIEAWNTEVSIGHVPTTPVFGGALGGSGSVAGSYGGGGSSKHRLLSRKIPTITMLRCGQREMRA